MEASIACALYAEHLGTFAFQPLKLASYFYSANIRLVTDTIFTLSQKIQCLQHRFPV